MDDDGSALRVGAKYKSFTDLECALRKIQQDNYVQLYQYMYTYTIYSSENEETLPGILEVTEGMLFPENDQQMAPQLLPMRRHHQTTLEIVSPKLYTAKLICILKIVLRAMSVSTGTIYDVLDYVLRRKKPAGVAEIA